MEEGSNSVSDIIRLDESRKLTELQAFAAIQYKFHAVLGGNIKFILDFTVHAKQ
jgi:hypothetical protein